jgi:phosphate transport system substrate-binding protein
MPIKSNSRRAFALAATIGFLVLGATTPIVAQDAAPVQVSGSKYMYFTMTELANYYAEHHPDSKIVVMGTDADEGLQALLNKKADAVMVLGKLEDDAREEATEQGVKLAEQLVGWGAVAVVVHPDNPVSELTLEQIRKIFAGEYDNWKQVGGPDRPIATMTRDETVSGTEKFFKQFVLNGFPMAQGTLKVFDHDIVRAVWKQSAGVADARFTEAARGRTKGMVKIIAVKQDDKTPAVLPSAETVQGQLYPISAPMMMYYNRAAYRPALKAFADFCSNQGVTDLYRRYSQVRP